MILVKVLKSFQIAQEKYTAKSTIAFQLEHKYALETLQANGYLEILKTPSKEVEQAAKQIDEATLQSEVWQLLLTKQKDEATELLCETLQNKTKFYATRFDEKSELYYYENGIYIPNGRSCCKEFCRKILATAYTEQIANRVIAKIEADNYIEQAELLKRHYPNEIVCENGILNLQTRRLTEFTPEKIFLSKIPVKYDPEATCPEINKFFSEILPGQNDVKTLKEWFGYCLRGEYPIQKIGLFLGEGGNGKGQVLELLRKMLGEGNCSAIPLQKLQEMDFKEAELFNRFANIGADISDQPLKETSKIKGLSGGDLINASVKFKNDLVFMNEAKLIFSANKLPKTYDLTPAFFRRWIYIVFPYNFKTQVEIDSLPEHLQEVCKVKTDDIIKKIITPQELSGILNESLNGLKRLLTQGDFTSSQTSEELRNWWIRNSDSCLAFCWEELEEHPDAWISKDDFRKAYFQYCRKNKINSEGDKHVHEVLTRQIRAWDSQNTDGSRVWNGIRFKEPEKPEEEPKETPKTKEKLEKQTKSSSVDSEIVWVK